MPPAPKTRRHAWPRTAFLASLVIVAFACGRVEAAESAPTFGRHVVPLFSKLGCNGGTCHGAVQGKKGFRLSLFGADPAADHAQLVTGSNGRRVNQAQAEQSLFLRKATKAIPHEGGKLLDPSSPHYELLRKWVAAGAQPDKPESYRIYKLAVSPAEQVVAIGQTYQLRVEATFADGSKHDVTSLSSFESRGKGIAQVDPHGKVTAINAGDTSLIVRYRDEPVAITVVVPRAGDEPFPDHKPHNLIDGFVLSKLRRLNIPPAPLCDDATFLRRATLQVTGTLPTPDEVRAFLADTSSDKRARKIDDLLRRPGHASVWTLKFCDLLKASDFGVYADGLSKEDDAPRFAGWVRARLMENTPYDELAERILLATSRDGKSLANWAKDVEELYKRSTADWGEVEYYSQRRTLDLYWQRKNANGVKGTLQIAHAFLGLRLECAQCHRHPHDVWQQEDLLDFANFFSRVRTPGFRGDNEKKYPEHAAVFKRYQQEGKNLEEEVKKLKAGELKQSSDKSRKAEQDRNRAVGQINRLKQQVERKEREAKAKTGEADRLAAEIQTLQTQIAEQQKIVTASEAIKSEHEAFNARVREMERRSKYLKDRVAKRVLHADIFHQSDSKSFASVTSPLGTQSSKQYRLLGESSPIDVATDTDPRKHVVDWLRHRDNPFFARAIVNRVWAHYFGRGIVNPPDDLSPLNPATHPKLLDALCEQFIKSGYDLRSLHVLILNSRTYQQQSSPVSGAETDRSNYAYFYLQRTPSEVLVDAIDQVTGTTEDMGMRYWRWPAEVKAIDAPFMPANKYITFVFEQFGKPKRNSAVQCDCERDDNTSVLQVMSLANHPRVLAKIADANGRAARIATEAKDADGRIDAVYLAVLSRLPDERERSACRKYLESADSDVKGVQGIMWSLLNTREFLLQH